MNPTLSANTPQLRETRIHGNSMFPFMIYDLQTDTSFEERINCHWHEEVEILVITKGCARLHLNDEEFAVTAGSICMIPSNALHLVTCEIGSELSFFALVFHPDLLCGLGSDLIRQKYLKPLFRQGVRFCSAPAQNSDSTQSVNSLHDSVSAANISSMQENASIQLSAPTRTNDPASDSDPSPNSVSDGIFTRIIVPHTSWEYELRKTLDEIYDTFTAKEYGYELFIKASLLKVCHLLVTHAAADPSSDQPDTGYHTGLIRSVMQYLQDNFNNSVTLAELEQHFHISQGHLCRSFKAVTHMTPFEYLNYYRISKSMEMLMDTDEEIGQIALRTGFNNISYFNRTFQRFVHMTPRAYRQDNHHT